MGTGSLDVRVAPANRKPASDGAPSSAAGRESQRADPSAAPEASFRKVVEHSEDVITLVDASGRVIYASPALERILGYSSDETVGRLGFEFMHPEDMANAGRVLADLVKRPGASVRLQQRMLHKDGSWRMMDGTVTNLLEDPAVRAVVSNFRDLSTQHAALEALEETEMRYRLVARSSTDVIWDWNLRTNEIAWAEGMQPLLGYRWADLVRARTSFFELIDPEDRDRISESIHAVTDKGGSFWAGQYRMRKADGDTALVSARGFVLHDEAGKPLRMVGTLVDITERQSAERLREGVIDLVSHEFKTPVTVIQGYAELLASGSWAPDEKAMKDVRDKIERSSRHLSYLLNSITELARLGEDGRRATVTRVPTQSAVAEAMAAMEARRPGPPRSVHILVLPGAEEVAADHRLLVIALVELLDNAAAFSPPDSPVIVTAKHAGPDVIIEVKDSGPGVPEAVRQHVFKPFVQGEISASKRREGAGLGLAVANGLVRSQGGRLELASDGGVGTVARIILPAPPKMGDGRDAGTSSGAERPADAAPRS